MIIIMVIVMMRMGNRHHIDYISNGDSHYVSMVIMMMVMISIFSNYGDTV